MTLTADINPVLQSDTVTLTVTATDNVSAAIEGLSVDGTPITLDGMGQGTWTPTSSGRFDAVTSAVDPTGRTRPMRVIAALCARPYELFSLLALAPKAQRAEASLRRAANACFGESGGAA